MAKKKATGNGEPKDVAKCDTLDAMSPDHDDVITSVTQSSSEGNQY